MISSEQIQQAVERLVAAANPSRVIHSVSMREVIRLSYTQSIFGGGADMSYQFTAVIEREGDGYVSLCPELDVASQGESVAQARNNLREAVELFLECAAPEEIHGRLHNEVYITRLEVSVA